MMTRMSRQHSALVCGAGGFIGSHIVKRLKAEGWWVCGVDQKLPFFSETQADEFVRGDLRSREFCQKIVERRFDEVYQLAADMGGAGYIFTGAHDADILHNSATINLNMLDVCAKRDIPRVFYSSSACMYPAYNQEDPDNPLCAESSAYPAAPDSEYGWEKLFSERLYLAYNRNHRMLNSIARYQISSDRREFGKAARKRLLQRFAGRLPRPRTMVRSRFGGTVTKPGRSYSSTNVSRARYGSPAPISPAP